MKAITQANATAQTARGCRRMEGAGAAPWPVGVEVLGVLVRVLTRSLLR
jgi:hypothetical protein